MRIQGHVSTTAVTADPAISVPTAQELSGQAVLGGGTVTPRPACLSVMQAASSHPCCRLPYTAIRPKSWCGWVGDSRGPQHDCTEQQGDLLDGEQIACKAPKMSFKRRNEFSCSASTMPRNLRECFHKDQPSSSPTFAEDLLASTAGSPTKHFFQLYLGFGKISKDVCVHRTIESLMLEKTFKI